MNEEYEADSLMMAVEEAEAMCNYLGNVIYESSLDPVRALIGQALAAKKRIDELENPQ